MENAKKLISIGPYQLFDVVGQGGFSVVRLAVIPGSSEVFACKIIPKIRFKERNLAKCFQLEIRVMQQLHHPYIVKIHDIFKDKKFYYVIMEYLNGGNLFEYVLREKKLDEEAAKFYMYKILQAVAYIHSLGICHRDLKPENILMDYNATIVKLSDFGLSKFINRNHGLTNTPVGSPCYASPECLSGKPYDSRKSDVWSCGVILFVIVTGTVPFAGKNQQQVFNQIKKANYEMPSYLSIECRQLIKAIFTLDTNKRPTADELLRFKWFDSERSETDTLSASIYSQHNSKESKHRIISLRKLDSFFGRDLKSGIVKEFENLLPDENWDLNKSTAFFDFNKTLKIVTQDIQVRKKKKTHRKTDPNHHLKKNNNALSKTQKIVFYDQPITLQSSQENKSQTFVINDYSPLKTKSKKRHKHHHHKTLNSRNNKKSHKHKSSSFSTETS